MRMAKASVLTYSAAKIQALYMNLDNPGVLKKNFDAVVGFLDSVEKYHGIRQAPGYDDLSSCILYRDVNPELVLEFLHRYKFSEANIRFTAKMIAGYIQDQNKAGELKNWSVALMSPKSGIPIELGSGRKIFKVDRSVMKKTRSERDEKARHIKVLTSPRDELVDLKDKLRSQDIANTDQLFESDPQLTEVYLRQNIRPKDRGLILLYALNTNMDMTPEKEKEHLESPYQTMPVRAAGDAIAVAFVFPKTNNAKGTHQYVVNGSV
jgi:hypothetical protein